MHLLRGEARLLELALRGLGAALERAGFRALARGRFALELHAARREIRQLRRPAGPLDIKMGTPRKR